jgi:hypothetical protein
MGLCSRLFCVTVGRRMDLCALWPDECPRIAGIYFDIAVLYITYYRMSPDGNGPIGRNM